MLLARQARRHNRSFAQAKTAAYTLTVSDNGKTFTNSGATAGFAFTLPAAVVNIGYRFFVVAGYTIVVTPPSGIILYRNGRAITNGSLILWQIGHSAEIFCDGTSWYVINEHTPEGADRIVLREPFVLRPGINANRDVPAGDTYNTAQMQLGVDVNPAWEVLGVNGTSALVTHDANGGILLTTAGADGDEIIIVPHVNTDVSGWKSRTLLTDASPYFRAKVRTQGSITKAILWAGLKLTNTEVKATDDDQCYFRAEDDVTSGNWEIINSRAGTDVSSDSALLPVINTDYELEIFVDAARVPRCFINGVLVLTGAALTTAIALLPFVGVAADGATPGAKALQLFEIYTSRGSST